MSEYVKWVQNSLKNLGYKPGPVDGISGQNTFAAIEQFQSDNEIDVGSMLEDTTHHMLVIKQNLDGPAPVQRHLILKNFTEDEFKCECGCGLDVCNDLKIFAQFMRDLFGWPLVISSGARCPTVNEAVGGVPDSCHLSGKAFDCYFPGHMEQAVMARMAEFAVFHGWGIIRYPKRLFCHIQTYPRNDFGE